MFSGKIKCGECGSWYGSKVWHSNSKYRRMIWQCNHKFSNNEKCKTPHLDEDEIKESFMKAVNKLIIDKDEIVANFRHIKTTVFDTTNLEKEQAELQGEMEVVAGMIQQVISENAHLALDQEEYQTRYNALAERFDLAKSRHTTVTEEITNKQTRLSTVNDFLNTLRRQEDLITEFDIEFWCSLVDFGTVYAKDDVRFTFKDGSVVQA